MNQLEQTLREAEKILRQRQIATFWKFPSDLRLTGDEIIFGDRGPCDFMGHTVDGRAILIEAKMTKAPRLAVPNNRGIKGHQWMTLRDAHAARCISLIAWQHAEEIAILPFYRAKLLRGNRRSIPWTGGASLKDDDPVLVVVEALIEHLVTDLQTIN